MICRGRGFVLVSFGLFAGIGAFAASAWSGAVLIGQGLTPERFATLALTASVLVVLASWLSAQLFDYRLLLASPEEALRRPVFVSWGGIIALPFTFAGFAWVSARPPLLLTDALACGLFVGHAIGRLGCLSYGCCYGRPTKLPLAITYRNPHTKAARVGGLHGVPLHPVQLYEAILDVGLVIAVNGAVILGAPVGVPTVIGMFGYSLGRFVLEFLKDNDGRMLVGPLSVNHVLCLGVVVLGVPVLASSLARGEPPPPIDLAAALEAAPSVLPAILLGAAVVFLGFGLHRGRVGTW